MDQALGDLSGPIERVDQMDRQLATMVAREVPKAVESLSTVTAPRLGHGVVEITRQQPLLLYKLDLPRGSEAGIACPTGHCLHLEHRGSPTRPLENGMFTAHVQPTDTARVIDYDTGDPTSAMSVGNVIKTESQGLMGIIPSGGSENVK